MRMRTIEQGITYIKERDPHTQFTRNALRQLVLIGEIPSVRVGNKYLVALENIEKYLANGTVLSQPAPNNQTSIQRIEV